MGGIFSKPKSQKPLPLPEKVLPPLQEDIEPVKRKRRSRGQGYTILTGDLEPTTRRKALFGGP